MYAGYVLSVRHNSLNSSFVLRNGVQGVAVEQRIPLYSPRILNLKVTAATAAAPDADADAAAAAADVVPAHGGAPICAVAANQWSNYSMLHLSVANFAAAAACIIGLYTQVLRSANSDAAAYVDSPPPPPTLDYRYKWKYNVRGKYERKRGKHKPG